jgi:hypothetical protein
MNRSAHQRVLALIAVQALAAMACAQNAVTAGDAGDVGPTDAGDGGPLDGPETSSCDSGATTLQVAGFQCPDTYPADPTTLCTPGAAFQQVYVGQVGGLRNVTMNIGLSEIACCYDSSGALAGVYVRDDTSHACWGVGGTSSTETMTGRGCVGITSATDVCPTDGGLQDAGATDAGPHGG